MTMLKKLTLLSLAALLFTATPALAAEAKKAAAPAAAKAAAPKQEIVDTGWQKRCPDKTNKNCEIFERMQVKGGARVAEFAIGYDPKNSDHSVARGAVVLPLGILLQPGVALKIDDDKPAAIFQNRYCTNDGCFSFVNFNKDILNALKKAKVVHFLFKGAEGQDVNLVMNLKGFEEALKTLE